MPTAQHPTPASELDSEAARLERLAPDFSSEDGFNARLIDFRFEAIAPWVEGAARCLELGSADGRMTGPLAAATGHLTAVDGTPAYVEAVRRRHPGVEAVCSLFESFEPAEPYDAVVMAHVLEHVAEPVELLRRAASFLAPGGRLCVTVPNASSLHRQVGVKMGLIPELTALNEADLRIGHRRVYTREALVADVEAAGLAARHVSGVFLKPLSNGQIEEQWSDELIRAYFELGKDHPELCAELLVVAQRAGEGPC